MDMGNRRQLGSKAAFLCLILTAFFLLRFTAAENTRDPTDNVNLSPFRAWRSAHWCLVNLKKAGICQGAQLLTETGELKVEASEVDGFCKGGCGDQTRAALTCVHHCMRHYKFANKARVSDLNSTLSKICP
ncbi:uncharacterized protein LOC127798245 [Diospyros lotus]|uniref:uncharacterized protein LOC127798245 n=1 Tax=Diospyros lotus TaxID=55363 RepID=UPI002252C08B|nr:uncharacterized protein LOC127798245 [Diospyros lotus]